MKKKLRKILRKTGWVFAGILVFLIILHIPPVRNLIKGLVTRTVSSRAGGELRIEKLDYKLWKKEATVSNVEFEMPGLLVRIDYAVAKFLSDGWISIEAKQAKVILRWAQYRERALPPGDASSAKAWMFLRWIGSVDIDDGQFVWDDEQREILVHGSLNLNRQKGNGRKWALVSQWQCSLPESGSDIPVNLGATFALEKEHLHIKEVLLRSGQTSLTAMGVFTESRPPAGSLEGSFQVEGSLATYFAPDIPVEGTVKGRFQAKILESGPEGRVDLEAPQILLNDSGPWSIEARSRLDGPKIHLDSFHLRGTPGSLDVTGYADIEKEELIARIHVTDLDPNSLLANWAEVPVSISSRIGAEFQIDMNGWQIDGATAKGEIYFRPEREKGIPLSGKMNLGLEQGRVTFDSNNFRIFNATLSLAGNVGQTDLQTSFNLGISASDFRSIANIMNVSLPEVQYKGSLNVSGKIRGDFQELSATAQLKTDELEIENIPLSFESDLDWDRQILHVKKTEILYRTGKMTVEGTIPTAESAGDWDLSAKLESLDLSDFVKLAGFEIRADGTMNFKGSASNPIWEANIQTSLRIEQDPSRSGMVTLAALGKGSDITVKELRLDYGSGSLIASGRYDMGRQNIEGHITASGFQLAELQAFAPELRRIKGLLSLNADFQGSTSSPMGGLNLSLDNLAFDGSPLPDLSFDVRLEGKTAEIQGFAKERFLAGTFFLKDPFPLQMEIALSEIPFNDFLSAFPNISQIELTSAKGHLFLDMPLRNPKALRYRANIDGIDIHYSQFHWSISPFTMDGNLQSFLLEGFRGTGENGYLEIDGRIPLNRETEIGIEIKGNMDLDAVSPFIPDTELEGSARIQFLITGTQKNPHFQGEATISHGRGSWKNIGWEDFEFRAFAKKGEFRLETLSMKILDGSFSGNGHLARKDTGIDSRISFSFDSLGLGALLQSQSAESIPSVRVSGNGELTASDLSLSALSGSGSLTRIETDIGNPPISLQSPAEWALDGGKFSLPSLKLEGQHTDLAASVDFNLNKTPPEWDIRLNGSVDTAIGNLFIPNQRVSISGISNVEIDLESLEGRLNGKAFLEGGRVSIRNPSFSISQIQARLTAQDQTVEISEISGSVGTGEFKVFGQLKLREEDMFPSANLKIELDHIPLNFEDGVYSQFSGEIQVLDEDKNYSIRGNIDIHRMLFQRELDMESQSLSQLDRQMKSLQQEASLADRFSLDLKADVEEFRLRNSLGQVEAAGALSIDGTPSLLTFGGSFQIKSGGIFQLGRARIRVTEGQIVLNDFPDNQPEINLSGVSTVGGIWIELDANGRIDELQTQIQAPYHPNLTQGDLAMLLMTGRTSSAAVSEGRNIALEELAASFGNLLEKRLGDRILIDVAPDQSFFTQDSDPTTRFSLGHQIASNFYIIYSTALNGTQKQVILDYHPNQPFRLRYIGEEDGRYNFEVNHSLGFRLSSKQKREQNRERNIINSLSFEGEYPVKEGVLQKWAGLKAGKRYTDWKAFQGAQKIQDKLRKRGYKNTRAEFEEKESSPGRSDMVYLIEAGKRIRIIWGGDKLSGRLRKKIEAMWDPRLPPDILPDRLAKQSEYALQAKKFYAARVTATETRTEDELLVQLDVQKGPKGKSVLLNFEGNQAISDQSLAQVIPKRTEPGFFAAIYGETNLVEPAIRLKYASAGFLQVQVSRPQVEYLSGTGELQVTVPIEEGPRVLVESIVLPSDAAGEVESGTIQLGLRKGAPFRIEDYVEDRAKLNVYYRRAGFGESKVIGILKPVDDKIAVSFEVDRGFQAWVGDVKIARPGRTRKGLIDRALTLEEGDLILPSEIALSRKRLLDSRVFQSVDIRPVPSEKGPEVKDLVVDYVEKPDIALDYGLRLSLERNTVGPGTLPSEEYSPFQVGGRIQFLNPFGYGHRYGFSGYVFGKQQFFRALFESEYFFRLRIPTQVYFSADRTRRLEVSGLEAQVQRITFQQYYRWGESLDWLRAGDKLRLQWNYSFRHIILTPITRQSSSYSINTDRGSISLALIGDSRDSFVDPGKGVFWSVSSEFSRTWLASEVNFNKYYGQAFFYMPLVGRTVFATGLRLGVVPGENEALIIEDRFKAGGPNSVRGFPLHSLGPKTENDEPLGGQAVAIFNMELRFPIYKSFYGGIFYDAGNAFALAKEMSLKGLRHSAGLGLRFMLPFGPIRLDWSFVIDPQPGESRSLLVFSLGHAF